jgi:glycosyltransferase involved in cell wall biosynthesis
MDVRGTTHLVCFSHLRWDFVFQRPNHLMSRAARSRQVFFVEEPIPGDADDLLLTDRQGVTVVTPVLAREGGRDELRLAGLVNRLIATQGVDSPVLWYETPMAVAWTRQIEAAAVVYDCMDQLSGFDGAPPELLAREAELLQRADLVFTGGQSLYRAKRDLHRSVHAFPSAVDADHFRQAREEQPEPADQAPLGRPRLGWFGVIDERMDLDLVRGIASARPDWQIVLVGPVVKIDPATLPTAPNIHYPGMRTYAELPAYLSGWDVAIMPFARNRATRYISPTKTPEYLAGGRPVVSTSIEDVIHPYRDLGLVRIADDPEGFVAACEAAAAEDPRDRIERADVFLAGSSWDETWRRMDGLIAEAIRAGQRRSAPVDLLVRHPAANLPQPAAELPAAGLGAAASRAAFE